MHTLATLLLATLMSSTPTTPTGQPGPMQPSDYTPAGESRVVSWQLKRVPPPSPLYVSVDDKLVVGAASSQTNEVVTVNYRLLRASDGVIVPGQFTVKPLATRAIQVQQQQLAEGFLLSVSVKAAVATTRGMTFIRVFLGAGAFGAGQPSYMLMADYVTTAMAPAHPNGRVLAPVEGPGLLYSVRAAHAPAGSNWLFTVPTNARWRVQSIQSQLVTAAAVANRAVSLVMSSPTDIIAIIAANTTQAASITEFYIWADGAPYQLDTRPVDLQPLPRSVTLLAGFTVNAQVLNIQAADQWSDFAVIFVEEWLDNV
jgi:hypothetical protein